MNLLEYLVKQDERLYIQIYQWVQTHPRIGDIMSQITRWSSKLFMCIYGAGGIWLATRALSQLLLYLLVPALMLEAVSILRRIVARTRPFDQLGLTPLIAHESGGSLPSKHAASAMIIAIAVGQINSTLGILCVGLAILTAISRVFSGVHYLLDVLAGIFVAGLFGIFFFL